MTPDPRFAELDRDRRAEVEINRLIRSASLRAHAAVRREAGKAQVTSEHKQEIRRLAEATGVRVAKHRAEPLILAVAEECDVEVAAILGPTQEAHIVLPRQIAMYMVRKYCGYSFPVIGRMFGGRHHTTVLHAIRKIARASTAEVAGVA